MSLLPVIVNFVNDVLPLKTSPSVLADDGYSTDPNLTQVENALSPIDVTESGISIVIIDLHSKNAFFPIFVIPVISIVLMFSL